MNRFLTDNSTIYRLLRTIAQGVIGVIIANLDVIIGVFHFAPSVKAIIVALVMAILSPIMSEIGTIDMDKEDVPHGFFEGEEEDEDDESDSE